MNRQAKNIEDKKYYAKIKGVNLLNAQTDLKFFYFTKVKDGLVLCSKLHREKGQVFTKQEWNKLGINDKNADFEIVEVEDE